MGHPAQRDWPRGLSLITEVALVLMGSNSHQSKGTRRNAPHKAEKLLEATSYLDYWVAGTCAKYFLNITLNPHRNLVESVLCFPSEESEAWQVSLAPGLHS